MFRILRMVLIGIVLGMPLSSKADDTWLMLSCCAHHWKRSPDQNEENTGLFLDHSMSERGSVIVGSYRNSQDRMSSFAAVGLRAWETRWSGWAIESRILFGAVSGYGSSETSRNNAQAIVLPALTVRSRDVGVIVTGAPGILLGLGLEIRLP